LTEAAKIVPRFLLRAFLGLVLILPAHGQSGGKKVGGAPGSNAPPLSTLDKIREAARYYSEGDMAAAQQDYLAVLKADPRPVAACAGLARVYLKQEKIREAEEIAFKGAEFAPDKPLIETARGEVYFWQGKIAEAQKEFVKAVNASPTAAGISLSRANEDNSGEGG
jgi:tetratricopeptide (TPR) repeat protein